MKRLMHLCVILLCACSGASTAAMFEENAIDKLFTTASERQKIDSFRKGKSVGVAREQVSPTDVKVQGMVKRSDGKSTVWVNGQSTLDSNTVGGVRVNPGRTDSSNKVSVSVNNKSVRLKPGQVWSEDTGQISDSY